MSAAFQELYKAVEGVKELFDRRRQSLPPTRSAEDLTIFNASSYINRAVLPFCFLKWCQRLTPLLGMNFEVLKWSFLAIFLDVLKIQYINSLESE